MDIDILEQFQHQIDVLLENYIQIKKTNYHLKKNEANVLVENNTLRKKQLILHERIEAIIQRLKEAESKL